MYAALGEINRDLSELLRPPSDTQVHESAEQYVRLNVPGAYNGPWSNERPHYMVEPAQCLTDRRYNSVIFAGPAQCAKTQMLVDNYVAHTIMVDPVDMMVVQTTQDEARDFSRRRIDRMHNASPEIGKQISPRATADNTFDKVYRSGVILTLAWPTPKTFAGKAISRVVLTDYDRMPDDIGGDGSAFELAENRAKTFQSRGKVVAESSPSREVTDLNWKASHPHEAPPCTGILGLFNTGDRRRAYCQCQHCGEYWLQPCEMDNLALPDGASIEDRIENMGLMCPTCSAINHMRDCEEKIKQSVVWLKQGETINQHGEISGDALISRRASFWLPGWFAAFERWENLVRKYHQATDSYERTKDEKALKTFYNTGLGTVYIPFARRSDRSADVLMERTNDALVKSEVPEGVRFLVVSIDVQKHRFVVQVEGFGVDDQSWIVDRFDISVSERKDDEGNPIAIEPAAYAEDWRVLEGDRVINREYVGFDGRKMKAKIIGCDMHGLPGASENAYEFWRRCKKRGLGNVFRLVRGLGRKRVDAAKVRETYPEQERTGKGRAGDVPVLQLNTNRLKDDVMSDIDRTDPGPGYVNLPDWLSPDWFDELLAEVRDEDGKWSNPQRKRNESMDLMAYARALVKHVKGKRFLWANPPSWAEQWSDNSMVSGSERRQTQAAKAASQIFNTPSKASDSWLR